MKSEKKRREQNPEPQKIFRVRLPRQDELLGIVEQRFGGNKMMINCLDGKTRNCRVPGRLRRKLWLRPNDIVIVKPWEHDKEKADILFKYTLNQVAWLRKNNYLEKEKIEF